MNLLVQKTRHSARSTKAALLILTLTITGTLFFAAPPARGQLSQPLLGVWAPAHNSPVVNDTSLAPGQHIRIDLNITNSPSISAFDVKLVYDFEFLRFDSADINTGTVFGDGGLLVRSELVPPTLRIAGVQFSGDFWPGGNGVLIHIDFTVLRVGVSPVGLYETSLGSALGEVEHATEDGYLTNDSEKLGPNVDYSFDPFIVVKGQEVTFDATASFDPDNSTGPTRGIRVYRWFFGSNDGSGATVKDPVIRHIFGGELSPRTGTFWVRLIAEDYEGNQGLKTRKVTVAEEGVVFDFRLSINPFSATVSPGSRTTVTVTATLVSGMPERVLFHASDPLPGVRYIFSPPRCTLSCESTLRIVTNPTAGTGTFVVVTFATSGGLTRAVGFILTIVP